MNNQIFAKGGNITCSNKAILNNQIFAKGGNITYSIKVILNNQSSMYVAPLWLGMVILTNETFFFFFFYKRLDYHDETLASICP